MGTSHPESRPWTLQKIMEVEPEYILDIGAGSGTYSEALRGVGYKGYIDAVEVWGPYIEEYALKGLYRNVFEEDVRKWTNFDYDVVIFGDILEHMTKQEALDVWARTAMQADYAVIAIPIIHYHQGAINDNPYEEHVKDDWTHDEVINTFPGIVDFWQGSIVGAYWADFR